jgi:adenine-specific DNA-methyltransferase
MSEKREIIKPFDFPAELIERLVLSMTHEGDGVLDPFLGTGTAISVALRHQRRGAGAEIVSKYVHLARERIERELPGTLQTKPKNRPVSDPADAGSGLTLSPWRRTGRDTLFKPLVVPTGIEPVFSA